MNGKWTMMAVAACAVALSGCQTPLSVTSQAANADCPASAPVPIPEVVCLQGGAACGIAVQMVSDGSGGCRVFVGTEVLRMRRNPVNPGAATEIFWWLAASDKWELRAEPSPFTAPVIFKTAGADSQFTTSRVLANGRIAYVHNRNTDNKKYEYKFRVFNKATGLPVDSPDPAIYNDGP